MLGGADQPENAEKVQKRSFGSKTYLFVLASGVALIVGTIHGVSGNFATDALKEEYNNTIFTWLHKTEIEAAKEGWAALAKADKASDAGEREIATKEYSHAIDKLSIAADANIPRAMAILHRLYCSGRKGYVEQNIAKGEILGKRRCSGR